MDAITSFGEVVMIVQDRSGSWSFSGPRQTSHSPAKLITEPWDLGPDGWQTVGAGSG